MAGRTLEVRVRHQQPRVVIIELHGEINGFAEETLNSAYAEAERENPNAILLNGSDVAYSNSTSVALVVGPLAHGCLPSQHRLSAPARLRAK